jgi:2-polyprenyl-3-methyl-5-hydroxy-6-metoxy-1,4-benzoquinol methylase
MKLNDFCNWLQNIRTSRILELGTCRSNPKNPTHHRCWAAQDATYIMSDFQQGLDVDIVADAHSLTNTFELASFDAIIACSVFEHIQRPWIAAQEIAKLLKPTGKTFIQTHQSFPIHGYPCDYWRFSADALETIFGDAGLKGKSYYEFPCQIVSKQVPDSKNFQAFLNVCIVAEHSTT